MKHILIIWLILVSHGMRCQSDTALFKFSSDSIITKFDRHTISRELKDGCYSAWHVTHAFWFKLPVISFRRVEINGNWSKHIIYAFTTQSGYWVYYYDRKSRNIVPTVIILDKSLKPIYEFTISKASSEEDVLSRVQLGVYELKYKW